MRRTLLAAFSIALAMGAATSLAEGQEPIRLGLGAGIFDTSAFEDEGDFDTIEAGVVLRGPTDFLWGIGPMAGVSANADGAWWVYFGARRPFRLGERWEAGLTFAPAYYEEGDSKELGHAIEFRSGLEVNYKLSGGSTLGMEFYHLSNAGLSDDANPGVNSLWVVYAVPLGR